MCNDNPDVKGASGFGTDECMAMLSTGPTIITYNDVLERKGK